MKENNLVSAPQAFGAIDLATFLLLTEPTNEREEFVQSHGGLMRPGVVGYCFTVLL